MAVGVWMTGLAGKRQPHWYHTRNYLVTSMFVLLAFYVIQVIRSESVNPVQFAESWLAPPAGFFAGQLVGIALHRCIPPLIEVWRELKRLARMLGGYALGYIVLTMLYAGIYAILYRTDSTALSGISNGFEFSDYWYYSVAVMTTTIDAAPRTHLAKLVVGSEVLVGIAWTVIVFAAAMSAVQTLQRSDVVDKSSCQSQ